MRISWIWRQTRANEAFAENQKKLDEAKKTLEEKQQELEDAKQELEDGRQELEDAKQELKDGWSDYYTGKAEAEQKISDAEQELADAKQEITDGDQKLADAERELADGEQKLADAEQDYRDGEDELEKLENPDVFVLVRQRNVGYACFESDSDIVRGVSRVFPLFFFAVAALGLHHDHDPHGRRAADAGRRFKGAGVFQRRDLVPILPLCRDRLGSRLCARHRGRFVFPAEDDLARI